MREIISKSFLLTGTEFALLLRGCDQKKIFCFPFVDGSENREDYILSLKKMIDYGIMTCEEGGYSVNGEIGAMIECIKHSDLVTVLKSPFDDKSDLCIYGAGSDRFLVVEIPDRKDSVKLSYLDKTEFTEMYLNELMPPKQAEAVIPCDEGFSEKSIKLLEIMKNNGVINDEDFLLGFDTVFLPGEKHTSVIVLQMPRGVFMITQDELGIITEIYDEQSFSNKLFSVNYKRSIQ